MEYNMQVRYIDKTLILKHVTEAQIFEYYLGVSVDLRDGNSSLFISPIRPDKRPTCKFFIARHGALYFHDFSGYFTGDCFSLVMMLFNVNYGVALEYIAKDMEIINDKNIVHAGRKELTFTQRTARPMVYSKIGINVRPWCDQDRQYWQPYHITSETLGFFKTFPAENVFLKNKQHYHYQVEDPAYAYYFGNQEFKIYWPYRKIYRFLCNTDKLQGYDQLPEKGPLLIITKAMKDIMCLYTIDYPAVAPQGETVKISEKTMNELRERFDEIIIFFDPDEAGIRGATEMGETHDLSNIIIPEHVGLKDISDFTKSEGPTNAQELMHELLDRPFT